jgi:bla regulator protein blaR1
MSSFLVDTLVWTGVLIALVLLVRRPTARLLGARAAYALWALPMARLVLPPIVLPAWMAPAPAQGPEIALPADSAAAMSLASADALAPAAPAAFDAFAIDWTPILLAIWLLGAGVFLVRRYALYFQMRRDLLARARPVGEAGRVRLIETPAADGPVAFGVIDKVVALPLGFMASHDRAARDLALAHELAHHRGRDLLCNMLVQPLFALHWFNPLATLGWRALRRDQEAACDARVMACRPREQRAAYAAVIAHFATEAKCAPRLALAAPMACPVLGDRSIVQRLKSLAITEVSASRRWSGRLLIGAAVLALPLTGSISYAQDEVAPAPPPAPVAPAAPPVAAAPPAPPAPPVEVVTRDGKTRIIRIERRREGDRDAKGEGKRIEKRIILHDGHKMTAEERAEFEKDMKEHREEMAELDREMAELHKELARERVEIDREVRLAVADAHRSIPKVRVRCRSGQRDVTETVTGRDGDTIYVCRSAALAEARGALASARAEIARSRDLTAAERAEALRSIDRAEKGIRAD